MTNIRVKGYTIENPKIEKDITIVSISDIHTNVEALSSIYELLKTMDIDIICIPGDIIDYANKTKNEEILEILKKICKLAKTYICLGNHDICKKIGRKAKEEVDYELEFFKELKAETDCFVPMDEYESINYDDKTVVHAIKLPLEFYINHEDKGMFDIFIKNRITYINPDLFNILLIHSPNRIINNGTISNKGILGDMDLILCGHNHGALTPEFIQKRSKSHFGFVGPYKSLFPRYGYGSYYNDRTSLIINNGVTKIADSNELGSVGKMINKVLIPSIDVITLTNGKRNTLYSKGSKVYKK